MVPFFSVIYEETERKPNGTPNGNRTETERNTERNTERTSHMRHVMRDDTNKIFIRLDIRRGVVASDLHTKNYERSEVK